VSGDEAQGFLPTGKRTAMAARRKLWALVASERSVAVSATVAWALLGLLAAGDLLRLLHMVHPA
jgi:hypothetical protein